LTANLNYSEVTNFINLSIYLDEKTDVVEARLANRAPILRFMNFNTTQIKNKTLLFKNKINRFINQNKKKYIIHKNSHKLNILIEEILELKS
jgi:pantothenate kinase